MHRKKEVEILILNHLKNAITPEEKIAMKMVNLGITCEDFHAMQFDLGLSDPERTYIMNHLKDWWRKK